jgi:hypothetical protein
VDEPGSFTYDLEEAGKLYQFNSNVPWPPTGSVEVPSNTNWGSKWLPANDPCPSGWRLPLKAEIQLMMNATPIVETYIGPLNCTHYLRCIERPCDPSNRDPNRTLTLLSRVRNTWNAACSMDYWKGNDNYVWYSYSASANGWCCGTNQEHSLRCVADEL